MKNIGLAFCRTAPNVALTAPWLLVLFLCVQACNGTHFGSPGSPPPHKEPALVPTANNTNGDAASVARSQPSTVPTLPGGHPNSELMPAAGSPGVAQGTDAGFNWAALIGGAIKVIGTSGDSGVSSGAVTSSPTEYHFDCGKEFSSQASHRVSVGSQSLAKVWVSQSCQRDFDQAQVSETKTPTDIVIVLDVSSSMRGVIGTVRTHLQAFVDSLVRRNWDARFALITFDERIERTIGFTSGTDMAQKLAGVTFIEDPSNNDIQEAGQLGIHNALTLLAGDATLRRERAPADKIILYISDALAYAGTNHSDFSVTALSSRMASIRNSSLPGLKFYTSSPNALGLKGSPDPTFSQHSGINIRLQSSQIATEAGVPHRALTFPFTQEVFLTEFGSVFENTAGTERLTCVSTSGSLKDSQGRVLANLDATALSKASSGRVPMEGFQSAKGQNLTLQINRCCVASGQSSCRRATARSAQLGLE